MNGAPKLARVEAGGRMRLAATGAWTGAFNREMELLLASALAGSGATIIDASGIEALDTFGAWRLERLVRERARNGTNVALEGLPQRFAALAANMARTNQAGVPLSRVRLGCSPPLPMLAKPLRASAAISSVSPTCLALLVRRLDGCCGTPANSG